MDKRVEPIDECYRGLPDLSGDFFDYTVTGNQPVIVRESLLTEVLEMGARTVEKSRELFPPGIIGPFSLQMIYNPTRGFTLFEISARRRKWIPARCASAKSIVFPREHI